MKRLSLGLVLGVLLLLFLAACTPSQPEGRVVFTMTDAAADMGAVSSVKVTVDSVSVHSDTEGWVTVSSTPKTYDLLELKAEGTQVLLADVQLKEGRYQQVRLDVSNVVVTDADGDHQAKLPSGELKIIGEVLVEPNTTSTVTFDFVADESLHVTGNGEYIMAPVVQFEARLNADVEVDANNRVRVEGGEVKTNIKVGMDVDGNMGIGLKIAGDKELMIEGGKLKLGLSVMGRASERANNSSEANTDVSAEVSV